MTALRKLAFIAMVAGTGSCSHTHAQPPPPTAVPATKPDHELGAETGTPVSSTPQGLMHDGAERKIQERLRAKGLLAKDQVTGRLDMPTQQALREFQKSKGLPSTGLPSYETVEHLGLELDAIYRAREHTADSPKERTASPR
jgi:hypothetical protein